MRPPLGSGPTSVVGSSCPASSSKPDDRHVPADHHAEAVVFDLVDPIGTGRQPLGPGGQAGLDEARGRTLTISRATAISGCALQTGWPSPAKALSFRRRWLR